MAYHGSSAPILLHYRKQATALIQRGTLKKGNILVAGTTWARVGKSLFEYHRKETCVFLTVLCAIRPFKVSTKNLQVP